MLSPAAWDKLAMRQKTRLTSTQVTELPVPMAKCQSYFKDVDAAQACASIVHSSQVMHVPVLVRVRLAHEADKLGC
jgi:hypothetical protein